MLPSLKETTRLCAILSGTERHACCSVIMQSSALEQKAMVVSKAALPSVCLHESSLLVMAEMSPLYQEESHIACLAHTVAQSQTTFFLPL